MSDAANFCQTCGANRVSGVESINDNAKPNEVEQQSKFKKWFRDLESKHPVATLFLAAFGLVVAFFGCIGFWSWKWPILWTTLTITIFIKKFDEVRNHKLASFWLVCLALFVIGGSFPDHAVDSAAATSGTFVDPFWTSGVSPQPRRAFSSSDFSVMRNILSFLTNDGFECHEGETTVCAKGTAILVLGTNEFDITVWSDQRKDKQAFTEFCQAAAIWIHHEEWKGAMPRGVQLLVTQWQRLWGYN